MSVNSYLRIYAGREMDPDFFMATLQCLEKYVHLKLVIITFSGASESAVKKKKTDFFFIFGTDSECNISHLGK